ncbi:hypothetical protein DSAG12_02587 [Promethearchaeum syntrophicum]|uniref:Uncharacterized protein n=1 Tax=Promethearchaeum syntrophicum TaxID=2594042 RepID=A0A5B9DD11_9ARCH|nr:hypothetical protein [Candidatus Prometheoarchaeum syntrophicum]QEE16757.1 hypothetical protein DSAG12_02587 [Candidatus Prometheoarchaeum syntrophicum]
MEPWQLYSILSIQLLTGIISLALSFLIYRRNKEYKGNLYLSLALILYSLYPFGRFFYELGFNELVVNISIRVSLIGNVLAMGSFLIAISIFCLGSYAKDLKIYKRVGTTITTLVCLIIIYPASIQNISLNPTFTEWSLILRVAFSAYILLTTSRMIYLLTNTMKELKVKNPEISEKLRVFRISLILSLGILLFSIIENITQIYFFNVLTYIFLLSFIIFFSQPLMKKRNNLESA